jgi:hypothetical protein
MASAEPQDSGGITNNDLTAPHAAGRADDPTGTRRARKQPGAHPLLIGLLVLGLGLGGFPFILQVAMQIYEATNEGAWLLLLPLLAVIGWVLLVVGVWSVLE